MTMKKIALGVEYDGHNFSGWQIQRANIRTVQQVVENALSSVADSDIRVHCAGRTDTGVHASGQVVHFETDVHRDMRAWIWGSNSNLPTDACVLWAKEVESDFHARFSARKRRYRYVILNRPIRPTYLAFRTTWIYRELNVEKMQRAANYLVGEHDFNAYRAIGCQAKSSIRQIHTLRITRQGQFVIIDVEANAFLHHMVRNIAGVLIDIGCGKQTENWARQILEGKDRTLGGVTASSCGLYFMHVTYDSRYDLPQSNDNPYFI